MPLIKTKRPHDCFVPKLFLNPRTMLWGVGTQWYCKKCNSRYEIGTYGIFGDRRWFRDGYYFPEDQD